MEPHRVLSAAIAGLLGCSSAAETARAEAISAVRAEASGLQRDFASQARGLSGAEQLNAVNAVLLPQAFRATTSEDGVIVNGAVTARREDGGGLSYEGFTARQCLRFTITAGTGATDAVDAPRDWRIVGHEAAMVEALIGRHAESELLEALAGDVDAAHLPGYMIETCCAT